jgi:long-chain acyl-CoA synthetase
MDANSQLRTLNDIFFQVVERNAPRVMLYERSAEWHPISASELYRRVMGVVQELGRLGISRGDRVAIMAENRPEWTIADFAILLRGAVTVPVYPTLTASQVSYLLRHAGARIAFVSTSEQHAKLRSIQFETFVEQIVLMDEPPSGLGALSMPAMMASGPTQRSPELDSMGQSIGPDELATVIYTSGTTGVPKGAMLTHGNIASNISKSVEALGLLETDLAISFLPLSHITARHVDFAELYHGVTIGYCGTIDELPRVIRELHPTLFIAVPRVYEKIYNKVQRDIGTGLKRRIYDWALSVGRRHLPEVVAGQRPSSLVWKLANRLVFSKVTMAMGGRIRLYASGGAPLAKELAEWYAQIGIVIHEGYGLTETSPVIAVNTPGACKLGTVGRPLPNVEVRIASDGELLVRGPSIFQGYWNSPEETAAAFEGDWFKTGDIGNLDAEGYLSITDRKKDLIKTSGGKFIAPQPIETSFISCPYVGAAVLVGDRRRFAAVVIFPAFAALEDWARAAGVPWTTHEDLVANLRVEDLYTGIVQEVNRGLAQFQQIKKFILASEEPSIAEGTLTPTFKLRRRNVEARFQEEIEKLYADTVPELAKAGSSEAPPAPMDAARSG